MNRQHLRLDLSIQNFNLFQNWKHRILWRRKKKGWGWCKNATWQCLTLQTRICKIIIRMPQSQCWFYTKVEWLQKWNRTTCFFGLFLALLVALDMQTTYIYLLFQTNTGETMKQSCLWQVLGAYLTRFTKLPKSALQLSQKRKPGIKPRFTNFGWCHLTRCSVMPEPRRSLSSPPLGQSRDDTECRQLPARVESPGRSGWLLAETVPPVLAMPPGLEYGRAEQDVISQHREKGLFSCGVG